MIAHRHRAGGCGRVAGERQGQPARGIGCCGYAATDGGELMKRMMARGLAHRDPERRGVWLPGR